MVQIADESSSYEVRDGSFGQAARMRQGSLSRSDRDRYLCRDGSENVAYRDVAFSVSQNWCNGDTVNGPCRYFRVALYPQD
ncbi:hypothetical protein Taro_025108 [Colocasia esculenta]|uniref:Uncharacterized protein n=1 Tax=Colocasia esculenta TaxID=4460 RepID=A0A843VJI3_COLES|nr:hypothetical protein [Colocasia esculenta]